MSRFLDLINGKPESSAPEVVVEAPKAKKKTTYSKKVK
jgi:hypothetical protein